MGRILGVFCLAGLRFFLGVFFLGEEQLHILLRFFQWLLPSGWKGSLAVHRAAVLCKALQHKADMVGVQLHKPAAYHLGGLIVPGDVQHLAFGGTGVYQ